MGKSVVRIEPLGVAAILTAWNSNAGSICIKLARIGYGEMTTNIALEAATLILKPGSLTAYFLRGLVLMVPSVCKEYPCKTIPSVALRLAAVSKLSEID